METFCITTSQFLFCKLKIINNTVIGLKKNLLVPKSNSLGG